MARTGAGANVNAPCDEGYTPLLCVCCNEGIEAGEAVARVEVLVRCPAVDLHAALPDGRDAVAIAAARSPPGSFASVVAVVEAAVSCGVGVVCCVLCVVCCVLCVVTMSSSSSL